MPADGSPPSTPSAPVPPTPLAATDAYVPGADSPDFVLHLSAEERTLFSSAGPAAAAAPATAREVPLLAFGKYELLRRLQAGGMGAVFLARDRALKRLVALKVLRGLGPTKQELDRFLREAQVAAALRHPGIVQVYEYDQFGDTPYLAMEFVPGGTLHDRLKELRGQPALAVPVFAQIASAVGFLHAHGIVHRDLKPANILLASPGRESGEFDPKVADFGLAKFLEEEQGPTQTGMVLGTPSYMAPEQAEGRVHRIGPPTDVWALGVMLYEALTGLKPFVGQDHAEVYKQITANQFTPPSQLEPRIEPELEQVILSCLATEPSDRYATAQPLAADLSRLHTGKKPKNTGRLRRRRFLRRWARSRAAVAATLLLVAGLAVLATLWALHEDPLAGSYPLRRQYERGEKVQLIPAGKGHPKWFRAVGEFGLQERLAEAPFLVHSRNQAIVELFPYAAGDRWGCRGLFEGKVSLPQGGFGICVGLCELGKTGEQGDTGAVRVCCVLLFQPNGDGGGGMASILAVGCADRHGASGGRFYSFEVARPQASKARMPWRLAVIRKGETVEFECGGETLFRENASRLNEALRMAAAHLGSTKKARESLEPMSVGGVGIYLAHATATAADLFLLSSPGAR